MMNPESMTQKQVIKHINEIGREQNFIMRVSKRTRLNGGKAYYFVSRDQKDDLHEGVMTLGEAYENVLSGWISSQI